LAVAFGFPMGALNDAVQLLGLPPPQVAAVVVV
jgi:hypothetical protein